jgi:hypothetical protein
MNNFNFTIKTYDYKIEKIENEKLCIRKPLYIKIYRKNIYNDQYYILEAIKYIKIKRRIYNNIKIKRW